MKRIFDLGGRALREGGETILGLKDLHTHACYLIYGVLNPGDEPRKLCPGGGHEEIVMVISGSIKVTGPDGDQTLQTGQAFHMVGDETWMAVTAGSTEARYAVAGGHTPGSEHSHHSH